MDAGYWNNRYVNEQTGWDIGYANKALTNYILKCHPSRDVKILIPGAGHAYEAEYLWELGYKNVYITDLSEQARNNFLERVKGFPEEQYIITDFFEHKDQYDVILEQTFFCALDPKLRESYAITMRDLLKPGGKLAGVLFNFEKPEGPPFGGSKEEYLGYFEPLFKVCKMEECYASIAPRAGTELFFELAKKES